MAMMGDMVAVDPVTIVIKECISLTSSMRKYAKYSVQSGVAALLGGGSDIFVNEDASLAGAFSNLSVNKNKDPLLSGFIQLRLMLNNKDNLDGVDSLTVLQPFLLVVSTSSTSGYITSLALDSLRKFFAFGIINEYSKNHVAAYRHTIHSLTHCKFEESQHLSDDSVLLKVLVLIDTIINSPCGTVLSDYCMYDVLQTVMSLACNKRRSDVLRKAAEMSMISITVNLFNKLKQLSPSSHQIYINDQDYNKNALKEDIIGTKNMPNLTSINVKNEYDGEKDDMDSVSSETAGEQLSSSKIEPNYGINVIKDYLGILVSLLLPENQHKQNNSTRVFSLHLLNTAVELAGDRFPQFPQLFALVSDPICKNILYIIQNSDKVSLLQAALQLFTNLTIILGNYLSLQIEFTIMTIFQMLLESDNNEDVKPKPAAVKELLVEQLSILWTRSPSFFTTMFINYDCSLDRSDLATDFLEVLAKLSLPESALLTSESVPPICLEGILALISDMHEHVSNYDGDDLNDDDVPALKVRKFKKDFIKSVEEFNKKPKKGIPLLIENGFIKSDSEDDIARFLFDNNSRLNKKTIGEYIASPDNISLLSKFIGLFDFTSLRIDEAIRTLLTKFRLPGESQQIERIVEQFSSKYVEDQNYDPEKSDLDIEGDFSTVQPDADSVFILSYSIIMLNTDFHNPQVKKHMTFDDYTYNLSGCNNKKDFPIWYLDKIYCSIRDKEIVMPEEHHGNERWFDDAWNNLIAATTVITESHELTDGENSLSSLTPSQILSLDKALFSTLGQLLIKTLFKIFEIASDDHIASRMLTTLDKCTQLSSFFKLDETYNFILQNMATLTTLTGERKNSDTLYAEEIPVVQINIEGSDEVICVSNNAIILGKDFKGQLSTVVFSRILGQNDRPELISKQTWIKIVDLILNLYENMLISPDLFPEFQSKLRLSKLPMPGSDILITKSSSSRGFLSTFASYLKGDEEPTEDEVKASLAGLECIKSCNMVTSIFGNKHNISSTLVEVLLDSVKLKKNNDNSRYFGQELLFLIETIVVLFSSCKNCEKIGHLLLDKMSLLSELDDISKKQVRRLLSYKLFVLAIVENGEYLQRIINDELLVKNEIYDDNFLKSDDGKIVLETLESLARAPKYQSLLLNEHSYWKLLRKYTALGFSSVQVYAFLDSFVLKENTVINDINFMWILGLFDEMSSIGAVGAQWERDYDRLVEAGQKVEGENPFHETVELSLKSINLTTHLVHAKKNVTKSEIVAIIQALSHQCLNPCLQIRTYALSSLENMLLKILEPFVNKEIDVSTIVEMGLYPLSNDLDLKAENVLSVQSFLSLLSKTYLHYLSLERTDNDTFLKVLTIFNRFVDDEKVEQQLQEMITKKRDIEKKEDCDDGSCES